MAAKSSDSKNILFLCVHFHALQITHFVFVYSVIYSVSFLSFWERWELNYADEKGESVEERWKGGKNDACFSLADVKEASRFLNSNYVFGFKFSNWTPLKGHILIRCLSLLKEEKKSKRLKSCPLLNDVEEEQRKCLLIRDDLKWSCMFDYSIARLWEI